MLPQNVLETKRVIIIRVSLFCKLREKKSHAIREARTTDSCGRLQSSFRGSVYPVHVNFYSNEVCIPIQFPSSIYLCKTAVITWTHLDQMQREDYKLFVDFVLHQISF